ncbi:MAG: EAL domain-containing protein, partial [Thermoanaerobaculia bacterium]|nr:EAL domain-containing protein [Thermoanaerobaculia bacterium]
DSSGVTWIGTNEGLARRENGTIRAVEAPGGGTSLETPVWTVAEAPDGAIWVGTDGGLTVLDPGPPIELLREIRHRPREPGSLGSGSVRDVAFLPEGGAWIGLFGGGVDLLRPDGSVVHHRSDFEDPSTLGSDLVLTLLRNPDGTVWVGTAEGLDLLDPETARVTRYRHDATRPASLGGVQVRTLYRDSRGILWIGTDRGLDRFLPGREVFEHFTEAHGLPDNTVYCILESEGDLWLSTNRGLARFDPSRREVRAFDTSDGLQALEFNGGSCAPGSGDRLLFGGVSGYNVFSPSAIEVSGFHPPVVITELRVDGESRRIPGTAGGSGELVLGPGVRMLSLEFAALDYAEPGRNRYSYRMDGVTHGWVELGETRELTLTNLSPGTFDVRIRGTNHDGVWSEDEARLRVEVRPPLWRTPSALAAYLLLIAGAALAGSLVWRRRARRKQWVQRTIRRNEERLQLALKGSGDGLWDWDLRNDRIVRVRMAELLGYEPGELPPGPELWESLIHPEDRSEVLRRIDRVLDGRASSFESEYRILASDGSWRWVLDRGNIVERDAEGRPVRMAGTCTDITERKETETQLRLWATVFESITDGVLITDVDGTILAVNRILCRMTKRSAEELVGRDVSVLYGEAQDRAFYDHVRRSLIVRERWSGEIWQERKDGDRFLAQVEITPGRDEEGAVTHFIAVVTDITRRKRSEEKLRFLARFDPLTGLANRTLFEDRLDHALEQARRREDRVALLFADLDRFKTVNDSLGHAVGDRLLKKVAGRLEECLRRQDTVARFGGDEFTVVLEGVEDREEIVRVAERMLGSLTRPFPLDGHEINVTASIGISVFPRDGEDRASLLKHADASMYRAKARGRNRYQFFAPEIGTDSVDRLNLESQLRRAVRDEEFILLYQPKIDLTTGEITGAEALVRWQHPERGLLTPAHFLDLAEETGLIVPLGEWILDQVCVQMARWEEGGLKTVPVSVNTSTRQLAEGGYDRKVRAALDRSNLSQDRLTIEITETLLMESGEASVEQLRSLQTLGVGIAMDDFGTGYSSLGYLRMLPIDELKIDRAFLQGAERGDSAIIRAVVAMSDSLGLTSVGEGVETEDQLRLVRRAGCGEGQGFYFSRPVSPEKLADLIRDRRFELP